MPLPVAKKAKRCIAGAMDGAGACAPAPRISVSQEHLEGLVQGARELTVAARAVNEYLSYFDKVLPIKIDEDSPEVDDASDNESVPSQEDASSTDTVDDIADKYNGRYGWFEQRMYFVEGVTTISDLHLRPLVKLHNSERTTCAPSDFTLYEGSIGLHVEMVVVPHILDKEIEELDYSNFPWSLYYNQTFVEELDRDLKSKLHLMLVDFCISRYGCPIYATRISRTCFPEGAILLPVISKNFLQGYPSELANVYNENLSASRESAKLIFMNSVKAETDDAPVPFPSHLMTSSMYLHCMRMAFMTPRLPMEEVQFTKAMLEASISSAEVIATQFGLTRRVRAAAVNAQQALMRCSPPSVSSNTSNTSWEPGSAEQNDILEGLFKEMSDAEVDKMLNTDDWDAIEEDSDNESDTYDDVEPTEDLAQSFKAVYSQITTMSKLVRGCSLRCIVKCCVMQGVSITFLQFMCMVFQYSRSEHCQWRKGKVNKTGVSTLQRRIDTVLNDGQLNRVKDIDKIMEKLERAKVSFVLDKLNIDFTYKDTANRYRSNMTFGDIASNTYLIVNPSHRGRTALVLGPYLFDSHLHDPIIHQASLIRAPLERAFHPKFPFVMKGPPEKGVSTLWHPFVREKMVGLMSRVVDKKSGTDAKRKAGVVSCRDDYTIYRFGFTSFVVNRRPLINRERTVNLADPRTDSQAVSTIAFAKSFVVTAAQLMSPKSSKKDASDEEGYESCSY
tara:strand:- start:122 stop:2311 length:2190 start_codon:yes stop_codon:yes gene_type:complete